jgi:hypothetical protein
VGLDIKPLASEQDTPLPLMTPRLDTPAPELQLKALEQNITLQALDMEGLLAPLERVQPPAGMRPETLDLDIPAPAPERPAPQELARVYMKINTLEPAEQRAPKELQEPQNPVRPAMKIHTLQPLEHQELQEPLEPVRPAIKIHTLEPVEQQAPKEPQEPVLPAMKINMLELEEAQAPKERQEQEPVLPAMKINMLEQAEQHEPPEPPEPQEPLELPELVQAATKIHIAELPAAQALVAPNTMNRLGAPLEEVLKLLVEVRVQVRIHSSRA